MKLREFLSNILYKIYSHSLVYKLYITKKLPCNRLLVTDIIYHFSPKDLLALGHFLYLQQPSNFFWGTLLWLNSVTLSEHKISLDSKQLIRGTDISWVDITKQMSMLYFYKYDTHKTYLYSSCCYQLETKHLAPFCLVLTWDFHILHIQTQYPINLLNRYPKP